MRKNTSGFTIVELLTVIAIIGILSTIGILSYSRIQANTRDSQRSSKISIIADALEKYYDKNGEYPGCANMTGSASAVSISLGGINPDVLKSPSAAVGTNSISFCDNLAAGIDAIAYVGDGSAVCLTGQSCSDWTLQYLEEKTGTIIMAKSRRNMYITIGTQTWAKANLNVGTMVTGVTEQTNNSILEKYCYDNLESNCTTYGGLYQWDEAMKYVSTPTFPAVAQGICPTGSHIPTDAEWKTLEMSLSGMLQATADTTGWRGTDEGTKLKSGGSSGLNMPLAGVRYTDGSFDRLSFSIDLWSSSESGANAWYRSVFSSTTSVYRNTPDKAHGFFVRCLRN